MKKLLAPITLLIAFSPLFFFKLGQSSLTSFDEAWYAAISKNILISHNPLNLSFNGAPFIDHPPAGFWMMSVSMLIFGVNEFGARFASAFLGMSCLAIVFLLGRKLSSSAVGIASAITLVSSPWFLLRARSGNLDVTLTFFFLLTFYLAILSGENKKYLISLSLSLSLLILTKTLIPFTIIPALIIIFWGSPVIFSKEFYLSLSLSLSLIFVWIFSRILTYPHFISKYLSIGFPQSSGKTTLWENIILTKTYLSNGLGPIFRPAVLSLPLGIFLIRNKYFLAMLAFLFVFLTPFALSSRGQIWHLVPVHPFLILTFFIILNNILRKIHIPATKILIIVISLYLSLPQISKNWHEFIDIPAFITDEAILSRKASAYPYPLVIDENFLPAAVFYSGKNVIWNSSRDFSSFSVNGQPTLVITHQWRLSETDPTNYQLLATDRDKVLILTNNYK